MKTNYDKNLFQTISEDYHVTKTTPALYDIHRKLFLAALKGKTEIVIPAPRSKKTRTYLEKMGFALYKTGKHLQNLKIKWEV